MSGVLALFYYDARAVDEPLFRKMVAAMEICGPDEQNYWEEGHIALGHAMLHTTFESFHECQPSSLDDQIWLTADVRIDDREGLIEKIFQVANIRLSPPVTDDQLILQAYRIWGVNCVDHMIGDFAFALWDRTKNSLFCATDQFGVSPLYYAEIQGGVCVSNNLNALRLHPEVTGDLDPLAIADYLLLRLNTNAEGTIYKQIKHIPAAHSLVCQNHHIESRRYWNLDPKPETKYQKPADYLAEFRSLLDTAVSDRIRTDTLATHLSGGMDSTSVTAVANLQKQRVGIPSTLEAYTIDSEYGVEAPFAKEVADKLGIENKVYMEDRDKMGPALITPSLSPPEPSFMSRDNTRFNLLNEFGKKGRVLLTGYGGDPLLQPRELSFSDFNSFSKLRGMSAEAMRHKQTFNQLPSLGLGIKKALSRRPTQAKTNPQALIPEWINHTFTLKYQLDEHYSQNQIGRSDLDNRQLTMLNDPLWRRIFCWNDPGFTNIPVKVLHPFFDTRLLAYAQTLPPFPWRHKKHILRKCTESELPKTVTRRKKTPHPVNALSEKIKSKGIPENLYTLMNASKIEPYIDFSWLKQQLKTPEACEKTISKGIMRIVTLAHWLENHEGAFNLYSKELQDGHIRKIRYNDI